MSLNFFPTDINEVIFQRINDMPVIISYPQPRMQVSDSFRAIQSPDLVRETNAWMASFFGYSDMLPDDVVHKTGFPLNEALIMNERTYNKIRAAMREQGLG